MIEIPTADEIKHLSIVVKASEYEIVDRTAKQHCISKSKLLRIIIAKALDEMELESPFTKIDQ